jgi:hypothetical protein
MNNLATARSKTESLMPATVLVPSMLVVNTFALLSLNWVGGIPNWVKAAAALFLSF